MKFKKKPVIIEAIQWLGNNWNEIFEFIGNFRLNLFSKTQFDFIECDINPASNEKTIIIHTLEGDMKAELNDWIIKGINGEYYPCKPDIFEKTYEVVE